MIHTYSITGMTSDDCRSKVEKALTTVGDYAITMSNLPPANPIISKEKESVEQHTEDPKNSKTLYTCPMHPEVIKEQPDITVSKY